MLDKNQTQNLIAKRLARELHDGDVVNLGIGIPTLIPNHLPEDIHIITHSENGIVGFGETPEPGKEDPDLTNAGAGFITEIPGTAFVDSALSFAIIRGGHLNLTVLGALQVDQEGSIANWMIPGKFVPGIGGAMDLCAGSPRVLAATTHMDKHGNSKILKKCTLPLTCSKCVSLIVTDMAVMEVTKTGLVLKEISYWTNIEDVKKATEADLIIPENVGTFE
ncbi:MAG: CoA transferase subunit B [Bacteriovoracaceae bacterium]|nr:CoA transferase subunit B [Bacteriovoracaceae bacterium]